ncbi:tape-measure protein [Streptomyces sp. MS06]|uniref:tape-measure protein n=1 Tax=Streptomyces sp. MS06 TaxID=3385974 RepID=UPI00399F14FC
MSAASAAAPGPAMDPLAGVAPALLRFRSRAGGAHSAVRRAAAAIRDAAGRTDRLPSGADRAGTAVRDLQDRSRAATRAATGIGRSARTAGTRLKSIGAAARRAHRVLARFKTGLGGVLGLLIGLVTLAGPAEKLLDTFGTVSEVAGVVMTAVNTAMRANPMGFLLSVVTPLVTYLIELAVNSKAGQRIIKQVFDRAVKLMLAVWKFMGPVLTAVGTVVARYFTAYLTVISTVLKVLNVVVGGGFRHLHGAVSHPVRKLRGIARGALHGVRDAVRPVLRWITGTLPKAFGRVKSALSHSLDGIGSFLTSGLQAVLSVVKGPVNGLIAFANWVIDKLNGLSFSILGHKFGVHLHKLPMLAEGGVALPGPGGRAGSIRPLSDLDPARRAARNRPVAAPPLGAGPHRIAEFREDHGADAWSTAEDLLFLASAHAHQPAAAHTLTPL